MLKFAHRLPQFIALIDNCSAVASDTQMRNSTSSIDLAHQEIKLTKNAVFYRLSRYRCTLDAPHSIEKAIMRQPHPWYSETRSGGGWFVKLKPKITAFVRPS